MQALTDPRPALRELCRVVRPGGEVWIDALNRYSAPHCVAGAWRRVRGKPAHMRYDDPWRLARWLRGPLRELIKERRAARESGASTSEGDAPSGGDVPASED